jgi:geranylgeranyl reductase family protein
LYDVIVVGGGLVGSYLAFKLAGMGHRVVVLERKKRIGEKVCCTGIIGMECVRSFAIESDVILRQVNSARLFSPSGNLLRLRREEPQACILDRAALDQAMANRAQRQGAEYMLNSPVRDVKVEADRVKVELFPRNKGINIEARVLVIATGFGSKLAEKLGLGDFGDFAIGAQAEVMTTGAEEVEVYFGRQTAPGFFGWLVPTVPKMARVGLLSRHNPEIHLGKLLKSLLAQGKIVSAEAELSCGGIPLKPLGKTFGERFVVVGDAAGQVKPTSGGGIYYGLLCAEIAADTLHQALQGDDLSAKSLGKYERDWRRKLGWELKIGYWARQIFERLSDRQLDQIFGIMKDNGIDEALLKAKDLSFDWHGKAILALLGRTMIGKTIGVFKLPSKAAKDT